MRNDVHQAPNIYVTGYQRIGSVYNDTAIPVQSWTQVRDNLSIQYGRHTFKAGYDQRFKKLDQVSSTLQYNFDPKTGALVFPNDNSIAKIVPAWPTFSVGPNSASILIFQPRF